MQNLLETPKQQFTECTYTHVGLDIMADHLSQYLNRLYFEHKSVSWVESAKIKLSNGSVTPRGLSYYSNTP